LAKRVDFSGTVSAAQAALATPTAYFAFSPPRPFTGRLWSVRKVVILATGAGPFAAALANVTAVIFVTGQPVAGLANVGQDAPAIDADVTNVAIPTTQFFAPNQLGIRGTDSLVIGVQGIGVTAGFQVWGHARLIEVDDSPEFILSL
jgi:hypothetical protein